MAFLASERATLSHYFPVLAGHLAGHDLATLETPGAPSSALAAYRAEGAGNLLIPAAYGGAGASAKDALRVQCALGSRAPSLAVASAMHTFSVATLVEIHRRQNGSEALLIEAIARQKLLLASGFAEGVVGQGILAPELTASAAEGGVRLSGRKMPCSLTWSMDLLSVSAVLASVAGEEPAVVVALIPANAPGLTRERFWGNRTLAAAENDAIRLADVFVPRRLLFPAGTRSDMHPVQRHGFLWFTLLIGGAYLGMAQGLVERVLLSTAVPAAGKAALYCELEAMTAMLESLCPLAESSAPTPENLTRALCVRYHLEAVLMRVSADAAGLLGGMSFIQSDDSAYLMAAVRCLAFHPPTFGKNAQALVSFSGGNPHAFN